MDRKLCYVAALCSGLSGCAATPPSAPDVAPLVIRDAELPRYWRAQTPYRPMEAAPILGPCERSRVDVRYTIDSDGFARDIRILPSLPSSVFRERYIENRIRGEMYSPGPDNPDRLPVTVVETFRFDC